MKSSTQTISLQSVAFQLRKNLLRKSSLDQLLSLHQEHQKFLARYAPAIDPVRLSHTDRFAWKFLREINILNLKFLTEDPQPSRHPSSMGIYQDIQQILAKIQSIWFPQMEDLPNAVWLKKFSTRKLAHYANNRDEIAFSLIFDSPDAPPEILNYLAYHELLHRQVGTRVVNGRRYHHTSEFKHHEQLFPNWKAVEKQITDYIIKTI